MTSVPEAPDADAVYLFDIGDMRIMDDFVLKLKRQVRIKILTEEGKNYGNVRIAYWHEDKIRNLKAHTILPNGKKIKLKKKEIYEEREKNTKYKVFSLPGVEVGSVIEYKYTLESEYLHYLEPWYFQHEEFTVLSRISVVLPPEFSYTVFFRNTYDIEPTIEEFMEPGRVLKRYTWEMGGLQPVKDEPYMRTKKDYLASIHFQLVHYKDYYNYIKFISTWEDLVAKLWDRFKKEINDKSQKELADQLVANENTPKEKAIALYNYVRDNIETTERGERWVKKAPKEVLAKKKGKGAEKNLLLVNLMRLAGLNAYPMLISTRNHGAVLENQPRLTQFNYLLACVTIGRKDYVFDTQDKYCPASLLPVPDLVDKGLLINETGGRFVKIPRPKKINMQFCSTKAELSEDGTLSASSIIRMEGYNGMKYRNKIAKSGHQSVVEKLLEDRFPNVKIDSVTVKDFEKVESPLVFEVSYHVPEFAEVVGDMMYLSAPIMDCYESNPFKSPHRAFPVEFPTNQAAMDKITLTLPSGMQALELPQNHVLRLKGISFLNSWKSEENKVIIERQFMLRKLFFPASKYTMLRSLFDRIVNADQGQIVLGQPTAEGASSPAEN